MTVKHVEHEHPQYFFADEPYKRVEYVQSLKCIFFFFPNFFLHRWSRDVDPSKFVSSKVFYNAVITWIINIYFAGL